MIAFPCTCTSISWSVLWNLMKNVKRLLALWWKTKLVSCHDTEFNPFVGSVGRPWGIVRLEITNKYVLTFLWNRFQEFYAAATADLERCGDADHGTAVLLQVCDGTRPGGAHVPLPEEHISRPAAHCRRTSRQNTCLRWAIFTVFTTYFLMTLSRFHAVYLRKFWQCYM